jgi:glutamyl-tRNA reductase
MSLVVVGLNHKTAPIELLEKLSIGEDDIPKALHALNGYEHVLESALLSTCNRIEVYAVVSKFHAGSQDLRNFLSDFCHVAPEEVADRLYTYHDEGAVRHLLRVAAGVDSMVVGESEILGQVRRAYQVASEHGNVHRILGQAMRYALRVGKRARTETAIGRNPVSVSSAAVELARRAFDDGSLAAKKVAIVGAGKMGRLAAQALAKAGATDIVVVNRSEERGRDLAERFGATSRAFDHLGDVIADSDIVICSTTATQTIIDRGLAEAAMTERSHERPLFIVDIAVPRDVEPAAAEVAGVVLRDIYDLRGVVETSLGSRLGEVSNVERIIGDEVERFMRWERSTEYAPTIASLVEKADQLRAAEMDRIAGRLKEMTPEQRAAVDHLSRRMVAKILHAPINNAKELSSSKQGHVYLSALRELFELDDDLESPDSDPS